LTDQKNAYIQRRNNKMQNDSKKSWNLANTLAGRCKKLTLPDVNHPHLPKISMNFSETKLSKSKIQLLLPNQDVGPCSLSIATSLTSFGQVTGADIVSILRSMKIKPNKLDILPSWVFRATSHT
jgi:hypothetical protein